MAWLRIDDGFTENHKIAQLTDRELRIWLRTLCYSARNNGREGRLNAGQRREILGLTDGVAHKLVALQLLDEIDGEDGVLSIHDWFVYNPKDPSHADRQARYRSKKSDGESDASGDGLSDEKVTPPRDESGTPPARAGARDPSPTPTPDPKEQLGVKDVNAVVPRPGPLDRLLEVLHDKDDQTKNVLIALHREFRLSEGDFEYARECAQGPGVESPTRVAVSELKKRALERASA